MMWNLFRSIPYATAYYEPFNERRWFDTATRGARVDSTHVNVSDYWAEYEGLSELNEVFDEDWKFKHLYMSASAFDLGMQGYLECLIEKARGVPVLQFNEMDFRLPWLRARFPNAKILHIYRHPRAQWRSTIRNSTCQMETLSLATFGPIDGFYLIQWGRDLSNYFPFLDTDEDVHPYKLFYQIWKLSYVFGVLHSDLSISLEEVQRDPERAIPRIMEAAGVTEYELSALCELISREEGGKQNPGAMDDAFLCGLEEEAEIAFARYLPEGEQGVSQPWFPRSNRKEDC